MKNGYPEKTLGDWTCICFGCELGTMAVFFLVVGKQNMMIRSRICQGNGWLVYSFWWPGHGDVFSASSPHIVSTKSDDLNPLRSRRFSENQFHINFLFFSDQPDKHAEIRKHVKVRDEFPIQGVSEIYAPLPSRLLRCDMSARPFFFG